MSLLYLYNDKLLVVDGKLAANEACCCDSGACCGWACEYVAEIIWPEIEDPEDFPDISAAMIAAGWFFFGEVVGGGPRGEWRKDIFGEENCEDPEAVAQKQQELEAEVDGIVNGLGGVVFVLLDPSTSSLFCFDNLTQQACEETYAGVFRPGVTCDEEPCEENPLP
jgi:hypothetical protein